MASNGYKSEINWRKYLEFAPVFRFFEWETFIFKKIFPEDRRGCRKTKAKNYITYMPLLVFKVWWYESIHHKSQTTKNIIRILKIPTISF